MLQGVYTAAAGMLANDAMSEVIANNLANASTPGFRQDFATFRLATDHRAVPGQTSLSPMLTFRAYTDFRPGSFEATQNPLDLALQDNGDQFFAVQTPQGERYTRTGNFTRGANGLLTTSDGHPVLGYGGPIRIPDGDIEITNEGDILVDGRRIDRLRVVRFDRINGHIPLEKEGMGLFKPISAQTVARPASHPRVQQGYIERSNVSLMTQMAQLIHIARGFEAYQRAILVADSSLNMLIQRVGGG